MAKKLKASAKVDDRQLTEAVRTSAQQIWQAGLGAFAKAQEEDGKVFAKLVKEGTDLQKHTQCLTGGKPSDVAGAVTKMADSMDRQASGSWDKLEQIFEDRVSRSLSRLDVPTRKDFQALAKRVEDLSKMVAALSSPPAAKKNAAKAKAKTAAGKSAARPSAKKPAKRSS